MKARVSQPATLPGCQAMGGYCRDKAFTLVECAMNSWVGSRYMETQARSTGFRTFVRNSELSAAGPAAIWVIVDEHEASIDDAWFLVTMDDSHPFASFPATRHERSYGLNFGDGHAEFCKLRDPRTELMDGQTSPANSDWQRLKQVTTIR